MNEKGGDKMIKTAPRAIKPRLKPHRGTLPLDKGKYGCYTADVSAIPAEQPKVLPPGHIFWGILEQLEPVGDGLVRVRIFRGAEYLVAEELFPQLRSLLGKPTVIGHVAGLWRAGVKSHIFEK
jgi:hypothetical protein